MKTIILVLLLSGCTLMVPVWRGDVSSDQCTDGVHSFTHEGITKEYVLYRVSQDKMMSVCGSYTRGCTLGRRDVYILENIDCKATLAHELNHVFGYDWVDRPKIRGEN